MATALSDAFRISVLPQGVDGLLEVLPTLLDEDAAYASRDLITGDAVRLMVDRYTTQQVTNFASKDGFSDSGAGGEFHQISEGDELWTAYQMYSRLHETEPDAAQPYFTRAQNLVGYYVNTWPDGAWERAKQNPCLLDHVYGWGLKDWGLRENDDAALAVLEALVLDTRAFLIEMDWYAGYTGAFGGGQRRWARLLRLGVAAGEVSSEPNVLEFRDQVVENVMTTPHWDDDAGMYYWGENRTNNVFEGGYAAGWRGASSFHIGMLADSMWQLHRVLRGGTNIGSWTAADVKTRIVRMADWIVQYGRDPNLPDDNPNTDGFETGASMGLQNGTTLQHRSASFSAYNVSLVNMLVFAYKLTGDASYLERAWTHFLDTQNNYTSGLSSSPTTIDHYVDSLLSSANGFAYLRVNKGELQYCYALFENGGAPIIVR